MPRGKPITERIDNLATRFNMSGLPLCRCGNDIQPDARVRPEGLGTHKRNNLTDEGLLTLKRCLRQSRVQPVRHLNGKKFQDFGDQRLFRPEVIDQHTV